MCDNSRVFVHCPGTVRAWALDPIAALLAWGLSLHPDPVRAGWAPPGGMQESEARLNYPLPYPPKIKSPGPRAVRTGADWIDADAGRNKTGQNKTGQTKSEYNTTGQNKRGRASYRLFNVNVLWQVAESTCYTSNLLKYN